MAHRDAATDGPVTGSITRIAWPQSRIAEPNYATIAF
jgi:hypothetical protein